MQKPKFTLALFHCQNIPGSSEKERHALEAEYRGGLRLFPLPCSGRMESIHLMKALEEFADAAYLVACPQGACRYQEGNTRARKRVARTAEILAEIGLEKERIGMVCGTGNDIEPLGDVARRIMTEVEDLRPSPVLNPRSRRRGGKVSGKMSDSGPARRGREASKFGGDRTEAMVRMEQR